MSSHKAAAQPAPVLSMDDLPTPPCTITMNPAFVEYVPGKSLTLAFPVLAAYLNPGQSMQGGFICAAFDNVFGPLSVLAFESIYTTTIDLITSYHRPIHTGDVLTICATVKSKGKTALYMTAEGYNQEGKLIASSSTNYIVLKKAAHSS